RLGHGDGSPGIDRHPRTALVHGQVGGRLVRDHVAGTGEPGPRRVTTLQHRELRALPAHGQTMTFGVVEVLLLRQVHEARDVARSTLTVEDERDLPLTGGDGDLGSTAPGLISGRGVDLA